MERNNSFVKIYRWRDEAVFAGILLAFAFMINHGIESEGFPARTYPYGLSIMDSLFGDLYFRLETLLSDLYITYSHIFSLRWWAPTYLGLCLVI